MVNRAILIGTALLLSAFITWITGSFAFAVEPETYATTNLLLYFFMAMVLLTPLWLVALLPSKNVKTIVFFRIFGIVQLIFLIFALSDSFIHQIKNGVFTDFSFKAIVSLLSICVLALYVLIAKIKPVSDKS